MGRRFLWRRHSYIRLKEGDTGCVHGLYQLLNYHHHLHNVKRILPRKRHGVRRGRTPDVGNAEPIGNHKTTERQEFQGEDASSISVEPVVPAGTNNSTSKGSIKARIKAFLSEKDESKSKSIAPGNSEQPKLQNVYHEETSDDDLDSSSGLREPTSQQCYLGSSKVKLREKVDVLEILKVNKQVVLEILQDQDIAAAIQPLDKESFNQRSARLIKSGSFPAASSSRLRVRTPSKLEYKHQEVWPQAKGIDILNFETTFSEDPTSNLPPTGEDNGSALNMGKVQSMRRASSLTESVDRYAQLFDFIFKKEIKKNLSSRSLKLGSEGESVSSELTPRAFRRRLSSLEIDYGSLIPINETVRAAADCKSDVERSTDLTVNMKAKGFENVVDSCIAVNFPANSQSDKGKEEKGEEKALASSCEAYESPDSVLATYLEDDQKDNDDSLISEGPDSHSTSNLERAENLETLKDDHVLHIEVEEKFKADFHYVKYVLDMVGLITKDQPLALVWHSFDQPLGPSLFDEIEVHYASLDQPKCPSSVKTVDTVNSRKLLFDLVNKALVDTDEKSSVYYPKALSFSCHVHPMPKGRNRILEEVSAFVVRCLRWGAEVNSSLDAVVATDLCGNDGWMNLQMEGECVALELEDLILGELLDDIIFSC